MKSFYNQAILLLYIFSFTGLFSQKNIKLIVPDATQHYAFYNKFKEELKKDNKLLISEYDIYPIWLMIKKSHGLTDSASVNDRHGYFRGSDINFYIEVFQKNESHGVTKNEIILYSDSAIYNFNWRTKNDDNEINFLRYNLQKIIYCINNNIKQKDLVIVTFNNAIQNENIRDNFENFPNTFVNSVKSMDTEIASKYSFNPLFKITQNNGNNRTGNYDVQMDITVRQLQEDSIRVKISLTRYPLTDAPFFNETILYEHVLEDFSTSVSRKFLGKAKNWLIKD